MHKSNILVVASIRKCFCCTMNDWNVDIIHLLCAALFFVVSAK